MTPSDTLPLHLHIKHACEQYLAGFDGEDDPTELYELFLAQLEKPLIEATLRYTRGNQSRTATILGLNRGTLRTKMKRYQLL